MWLAICIIGFLGIPVAIVGALIMAIKRNSVWKKWLAAVGVCFLVFIVGAVNIPSSDTTQSSINSASAPEQTVPAEQTIPVEQSDSVPVAENPTNNETNVENKDQTVTPVASVVAPITAPATTSQTAQSTTNSNTVSSTPAPQNSDQDQIVYITKTGKKYHMDGCSALSKSKIPISLSEAKAKGYTPCKLCNPPQ